MTDGCLEFAPNTSAFGAEALLVAYLTYPAIHLSMQIDARPLNLAIVVLLGMTAAAVATPFPATMLVSVDGLEQVS